MPTPASSGWMALAIGRLLNRIWNRDPIPPATDYPSPAPGSDPLPSSSPVPPRLPSSSPSKKRNPRKPDAERGLCASSTTAAGANGDEGQKQHPFHDRMSDGATSIAGCLVALAFVLLLKAPTSVPSVLLCAYCYFAMLDLIAGSCIYYLHVARAPSPDVARVQATAAIAGLAAAVMDGLVLCYFFVEPARFWGLAFALMTSAAGFWGFALATVSRE